MPPAPALRIAVLDNCVDPTVRSSFISAINVAWIRTRIAYPPVVQFFDATDPSSYPKPSDYDLIILSGGTVDGIYDGEPLLAMEILMAHNKAVTWMGKSRFANDQEFLDELHARVEIARQKRFSKQETYVYLKTLLPIEPNLLPGLIEALMPTRQQDPEAEHRARWVLELREFIRTVISEKRKLLGIGLGHQIICLSEEGGLVERMDSSLPAKLGREPILLTNKGAELFPWFAKWERYMWLHDFHSYKVIKFHPSYRRFAVGVTGLVSRFNKVITIDRNPELNYDAVLAILHATPEYRAANEEERATLSKDVKAVGDGTRFWEYILYWASPSSHL